MLLIANNHDANLRRVGLLRQGHRGTGTEVAFGEYLVLGVTPPFQGGEPFSFHEASRRTTESSRGMMVHFDADGQATAASAECLAVACLAPPLDD